jgi:type I restriction enzyme S subunit
MTIKQPPGWAVASLEKLGDWLGGGTPSKAVKEYWRDGTVHWVSPKDMKRPLIDSAQDQITERAVKESATNLVPANSVLMVTRSGILEHSFPVAVNTVPVTMNQDLKAVAIRGVDPIYTRYFLQWRAQDILRTCRKDGTTVASIDTDRLAAYEVVVAPAAEQKRIVSKLDEIFSQIDEGERALERVSILVERYRQSVLKAAVTGELTREWREKNKDKPESGEALLARILAARREAWEKAQLNKMRAKGITPANDEWKQQYEEPSGVDLRGLPGLPSNWTWASAEAICSTVHSGSTPERSLLQASPSNGVPFIKVYNLRFDGSLDFTVDPTYVDAEHHQKRMGRSRTIPGDVLTNIVGPPLGKVSVVPSTFSEWNINQAVVGFRLLRGVRNDLLSMYLQSDVAKRWLGATTKTTTSQVTKNHTNIAS